MQDGAFGKEFDGNTGKDKPFRFKVSFDPKSIGLLVVESTTGCTHATTSIDISLQRWARARLLPAGTRVCWR